MATLIQLVALFVILAIVFAVLGKRGIAGISWSIAKWLFIAFIVLAVIAFIFQHPKLIRRSPKPHASNGNGSAREQSVPEKGRP